MSTILTYDDTNILVVPTTVPTDQSQLYSASALQTFYTKCEYQFYLHYVEHAHKIQPSTKNYETGHTIHAIIDQYFHQVMTVDKIKPTIIEQSIIDVFNQHYNFNSNRTIRIQRMMRNFITHEITRFRKDPTNYLPLQFANGIVGVELRFKTSKLTGVFDLVLKDRIIDWKTNTKTNPNVTEYIIQANVYYNALYELQKNHLLPYTIKDIYFVFLDTGKSFVMRKLDDEAFWSLIDRIEQKKQQKNTVFTKNHSAACYYCPYQLACQFANDSLLTLL